jgi:hypothetical protein
LLHDLGDDPPIEIDVDLSRDYDIMSPTYSVKSPTSSVASSKGSIMTPIVVGKDSMKEKRVQRLSKARRVRKNALVFYRENPRRSLRLSTTK